MLVVLNKITISSVVILPQQSAIQLKFQTCFVSLI